MPRLLWSAKALVRSTTPARGLSFSVRARGVTCQRQPSTPSQRRMSRGARAPALIISYEEAQHSSLLRTCAMPRWLWPAYTPRKKPALARGLSPSTGDCGATCQLRRPTPSQLRSYRAAHARRRSLSLGRRRSTRACCVRAQYRADCGRPMPSRGTLRWQEAILHQRLPVMRRASCGLQRQASSACHAAHARRRLLSLGRRRSTRDCGACVPCCAGCDRRRRNNKRTAPARGLSSSACACGATCQYGVQCQASAACHAAHARHLSLYLWGGAALELAAFARRAALAMVGPSPLEGHIASKKPLPFSAHPWCDVPAAASNAMPAPLVAHARRRTLSRRRRRTTRACCARAPCCAGCGRLMSYEGALH